MKTSIANFLFETRMLKEIPRSGFHFLGTGRESIAEHSFLVTVVAYVMSKMAPEVDGLKLISMCLLHDLPEARIGDLNYVQKKYVTANESRAVADCTRNLPFGPSLAALIREFNAGETLEAQLAHDADQLALVLELKSQVDIGYGTPRKWLPFVLDRLRTELGKTLAEKITLTDADAWWFMVYDTGADKDDQTR